MASLNTLVCILSMMMMAQVYAANDTCDRTYQKIGCFRGNKADLVLAITDRDHTSKNYSGKYMEWAAYPRDLRSLICRCDNKAKELGYQYFAIEYYAECWMVRNTALIQSHPQSEKCVNVNLTTCGKEDKECAGKGFHQYVYNASERWVSIPFANSTGIPITPKQLIATLQAFPKQYMLEMDITINKPVSGDVVFMQCEEPKNGPIALWIEKRKGSETIISGTIFEGTQNRRHVAYNTGTARFDVAKPIRWIVSRILRNGEYVQTVVINGEKRLERRDKDVPTHGKTKCYLDMFPSFHDSPLDATLRNGVIRVKWDR